MKKTLDSILAEHPFPKGLSRAHLKFLAGCARNVRFEEGSFLLREGQGADHFYLIRRGRVSIEIYAPGRGAIPVQTVEAGEVLGWSWIVPPTAPRFDARPRRGERGRLGWTLPPRECSRDHELGYDSCAASPRSSPPWRRRVQLLDLYGRGARDAPHASPPLPGESRRRDRGHLHLGIFAGGAGHPSPSPPGSSTCSIFPGWASPHLHRTSPPTRRGGAPIRPSAP